MVDKILAKMKDTTRMKKFVELGFDDCSIDFKVREVDGKSIRTLIELVDGYNDFVGKDVGEAIEKIDKVWDNSYQLSYTFGREGSCVLYIRIPYWKTKEEKYTEEEKKEKIERTFDILKAVKPDELWVEDHTNSIRAWWD